MSELLIRNATVFTGTGDLFPRASVLVSDGRIAAVGPDVQAPDGASQHDASGQFMMAGFIDAHTHLALASPLQRPDLQIETFYWAVHAARQKLATGVTTVRDIGGNSHADLALRDAIRRGQVPGPRMVAAGKFVVATGGHGHYWGRVADGPDEVRKAVREQVKAGADFIKLMLSGGAANVGERPTEHMQFQPEEIKVAVLEATEAGRRVAAHAHPRKAVRAAAELGIWSIEHATGMDDAAIEAILKNDVWVVPTQAVYRRIASNVDGHPAEVALIAQRVWEQKLPYLERAVEAGVKIGVGTDCCPYFPFDDFVSELVELQEVGMTAEQALLAATRGNASLMGLEAEIGTIEPGKMADLVLLGGNPLESMQHARDVRKVIQGGVMFDPSEVLKTGRLDP